MSAKYEYRVLMRGASSYGEEELELQEEINSLGKLGWKLTHVIKAEELFQQSRPNSIRVIHYFERKLVN